MGKRMSHIEIESQVQNITIPYSFAAEGEWSLLLLEQLQPFPQPPGCLAERLIWRPT
jgi:hypothetical protein